MAEIPSPALLGVQRVVIACDPVSGLSDGERDAFCKQLVKKADAVTDYPVSIASAADLNPANMARRSNELLLRVTASAMSVDAGRKTIELTVTPVRAARPIAPIPALKSSLSFVKVQNDWTLQGPVDAFSKILGGTRGLHKPIVSES